MNLNNLLLFWSSFLLRTNGHGQPTVGWSAQSSSKLVFMLHLIIERCYRYMATMHNLQHDTVSNVSTTVCPQCVQGPGCPVSGSPADLQCQCKHLNSKSAGHGAGVSFPVQIQPGDAGQGWTGSSPQLGSYLLSVGAAALCNSIHSSTARRVAYNTAYTTNNKASLCSMLRGAMCNEMCKQ